ncbi:MAG TPA: alkaline phosphatase D family protein [Polyangium sp.]|nr:alkaline phosphatase D family protein [Polyangium sp.]
MIHLPRRDFLIGSLSSLVLPACTRSSSAPTPITAEIERPQIPFGVQSGDPLGQGVVVWSKTDRPARFIVEWGTEPSLKNVERAEGPVATRDNDFTSRVVLPNLPPGRTIHYRVVFEADNAGHARSKPALGSFRSPPSSKENVRIAWSGDTVGQGFGIDVSRGGLKTYSSILKTSPDLFIHSGDRIYADDPLFPEVKLPNGSVWKNIVTPAKSKVAETLDEFRGNFAYNFIDEHVRSLHAEVATINQWDDHEVHNNWYPGQFLEDRRYRERRTSELARHARRAMEEYTPKRPGSIHRVLNYGPHADIFVLDARSFRGPNGPNREESNALGIFGSEQIAWLETALSSSKATWKIIACDQPIGLMIPDGQEAQEGFANGNGAPRGREIEIAALLTFIQERRIRNIVWITADVHYAAAHHYDPVRARYKPFDAFWEFVAGPLHAGTFGPQDLDDTFGPEVRFRNREPGEPLNLDPSVGKQSFGLLSIDGPTGRLRVSLHDREGVEMWGVELEV